MRILIPVALLLLLAASCDMLKASQVQNAVIAALGKDARTAQYKFEVSYEGNGAVNITGEVYKAADIEAVTEVAKTVAGVTSVLNNCHVEEASSGMLQDETVPLF